MLTPTHKEISLSGAVIYMICILAKKSPICSQYKPVESRVTSNTLKLVLSCVKTRNILTTLLYILILCLQFLLYSSKIKVFFFFFFNKSSKIKDTMLGTHISCTKIWQLQVSSFSPYNLVLWTKALGQGEGQEECVAFSFIYICSSKYKLVVNLEKF